MDEVLLKNPFLGKSQARASVATYALIGQLQSPVDPNSDVFH
jgi:hypothetical protein